MPHTIASYLTQEQLDTVRLGLKALTVTLPKAHPRRQLAVELALAIDTGTWLCETTEAPPPAVPELDPI